MSHRFLAGAVFFLGLAAVASARPGLGGGNPLVQPPPACSAVPTTLAPGGPVSAGDLAAFEFLSPTVGVGLTEGQVFCRTGRPGASTVGHPFPVRLVVTTDAGRHWSVEGAVAPPASRSGTSQAYPAQPLVVGGSAEPPVGLAFSSPGSGWAEVDGALSSTTDGGASWRRVSLGAPVASLAGTQDGALAVTWGRWQLWSSGGASGGWRRVSGFPAAPRATEAEIAIGPAPADVLVGTSHYGDAPPLIAETSDGGLSWHHIAGPCRPPRWMTVNAVAEAPGGTLAVVCLGGAAAGSATHAFYVSEDRGRTWSLRADDTNLAGPDPSGIPRQDSAIALAAPAEGHFYLGTENTFSESLDGGRHWRAVPSGYDGYGVPVVDFVDARHGWALLSGGPLGTGLIATNDGAHWAPA